MTWEAPDPERWVPDGYAIIVADARGTGKSPGFYEMMSPLQTRDLYDVVERVGRAHVVLNRRCHQGFNESVLFSDFSVATIFPNWNLLAEFID